MSIKNGKKAVRKGKAGEREFIRTVYRLTDGAIKLQRNLQQSRDGGDDIANLGNYSIEVKRWKKISDALLRDWWEQCQRNAERVGKIPVLAYRADQQSWKVMMHPNSFFPESDVDGCLTMAVELFAKYLIKPDTQLLLH